MTAYALKKFLKRSSCEISYICIFLEKKKKINSFQTLLKLNDNVCHERKYYRVAEVKSGRKCHIYRE